MHSRTPVSKSNRQKVRVRGGRGLTESAELGGHTACFYLATHAVCATNPYNFLLTKKLLKQMASRTMYPRGLQIYLQPRVTLTLTSWPPKVDCFMSLPCRPLVPIDIKISSFFSTYHACQFRDVTDTAEIRFRRILISHSTSIGIWMQMQIYSVNYLQTLLPNERRIRMQNCVELFQ